MAAEEKGSENLFDSFYTHFLLRDFLGKILPGALLIFAFCYTVPSFREFVAAELERVNLFETPACRN